MTNFIADAGSFRDPGGQVFTSGERVLRAVMLSSAPAYEAARDGGLLDALVEKQMLVGSKEVDPSALQERPAPLRYLLEHPRIPFVSYPYEWSFSQLKSAALHHLDLHLAALAAQFTLSDATAYNVQFIGARPIFIDHLSVVPYREGQIWAGHRQFCMQFLNPLLLWALRGVQPNAWFRGSLEGIPPEDLSPLLSWRHKMSWTVLTHVAMQASLQRRSVRQNSTDGKLREQRLPRHALTGMLSGLRSYIAGLKLANQATVWGNYAQDNSYQSAEAAAKRRFVSEMVQATRPALLLDLGCNSGDYSIAALEAGAGYVVGFDYDQGALEHAYQRSLRDELRFLPLWLDAANPSPSQGWGQAERKGMAERARADALIALAFIHHIVIGRNVPLGMAVDWLMQMAPQGVIEFPPKEDPMVQRLLALREDIFPDYSVASFLAEVGKRGRVVKSETLSEGGRVLVWYERGAR